MIYSDKFLKRFDTAEHTIEFLSDGEVYDITTLIGKRFLFFKNEIAIKFIRKSIPIEGTGDLNTIPSSEANEFNRQVQRVFYGIEGGITRDFLQKAKKQLEDEFTSGKSIAFYFRDPALGNYALLKEEHFEIISKHLNNHHASVGGEIIDKMKKVGYGGGSNVIRMFK